ncbi:immunity 49 family protein [Streptomyces sp. ACA25]|uniref:immunity 49 family protein n=1 Tax=Streptomyces sp. ACA25 TaxID=3022596 RepID=UPI0023070B9E|nr:immunity 49 family protein [Streptomyces sp. ACA25]MDB1086315.1 immunity 49 family protein [Streptomyces sp. ACA25]
MTIEIARPVFPYVANLPRFLQDIDASIGGEVDVLAESPGMFNMAFLGTLTRVYAHSIADPAADKFETWDAWVTAMQVGSALFAAAVAPLGTTVACRINHEVRAIPATGAQYFTDAGNWLTAFWLAVICRDQGRMSQLCRVPLSLLRDSGAEYDEYIYSWVDALQSYWTGRPGMADKLIAAFEGADPAVARAPRDLLLMILSAPIDLFYRFVRRDPEQINSSLVQALQLHKEYWTADEDRLSDVDGFVALGPLAIACLAYDAGHPINVQSEYLPEHLLKRSWLGEFPT